MNAVEIEEAVSQLAEAPFDPEAFPFAFLEAFGNKATTIKKLRSTKGSSNHSDLGGVLQRNNIHLKVCPPGQVADTLTALRESPATSKHKAKFILATDGQDLQAENLADGETIACDYPNFADHFGFFLPLAGITTVKQIRENAFDIKATARLNRLYTELLKTNPDWDTAERREEMNHFMARLIFCFFAEDTNIFHSDGLFTHTVAQMSASDSSNTHKVLADIFRAMATPLKDREAVGIRNWANGFPYVNGGLFGTNGAHHGPHPLTPSPKTGEEGQEAAVSPLSQPGRGAGGEGQGDKGNGAEATYWEIPPSLKQKMTAVARQFRKEPTPSEATLWQALRGRKLEGRKFRRQQPIGAFIVDFFCGAERLIVEVDGGIHESQKEADQQRQELLESLGLRVVRIPSELVETSLEQALVLVRQGFGPHPLTPSPKTGEGGQEAAVSPLSQPRRGAGGEGLQSGDGPHPLTPSPKTGEGGQEAAVSPLSQPGRGAGGEGQVPRFSKIARSYLLHVGNLDWTKINPDIFGSMIQAVADEEERGALGMHYTSVPNILKVLNPLFLDDLREQLAAADDNPRKLLNLRKRMAKIRVFDPACGSGNFLVIAYKEMRAIEAEINRRRGEPDLKSEIPLTNFRGIEIRHFSCEIARLALIIAEYQCDVLYRGQRLALAEFLPLKADNWITCGNALRLDWLSICPPTGTGVKVQREDLDLWGETQDEAEVDFENEGGETYICGNPPYLGTRNQTNEQKVDIEASLSQDIPSWRSLDYVCGWLINAGRYLKISDGAAAFVTTSSICQGLQVPILWGEISRLGCLINFAHTPFSWKNLAAHNAGVTVIIVGFSYPKNSKRLIYTDSISGEFETREVENINGYLAPAKDVFVTGRNSPLSSIPLMDRGSAPVDDGNMIFEDFEYKSFKTDHQNIIPLFRRAVGGSDFIKGKRRFAIYIPDKFSLDKSQLAVLAPIAKKISEFRRKSPKIATKRLADQPLKFAEDRFCESEMKIFIPQLQSEGRDLIVCGVFPGDILTIAPHFDIPTSELFPFALLSSRIHLVWIATVCGKLKTDFRYSNTLGWNTFPADCLTEVGERLETS